MLSRLYMLKCVFIENHTKDANSFRFLPGYLLDLILRFPFNKFNDFLEYSKFDFDALGPPFDCRNSKLN
jgi:hypothetical protein